MNRIFTRILFSSLLLGALCGNLYASNSGEESATQGEASMMRIKRPEGEKKVKVQKRDRSTFGFYAFGGMSFSTFVGQEVYNWNEKIGVLPGYTFGGGFDILRRPNGIYFGTEIAFTMKGVTKDYQGKPLYGEDPVSSKILLNYFQATPLKVGGRFKLNDDMGISLYTGLGFDLLVWGRERYEKNDGGYTHKLMYKHADWNGRWDMFVPFNVNFDYKQWSLGISYDLGIKDIINGQQNQKINNVHNSCVAIKAIYHFRFKDRVDRVTKTKEKKVVDKYHRDEF